MTAFGVVDVVVYRRGHNVYVDVFGEEMGPWDDFTDGIAAARRIAETVPGGHALVEFHTDYV